MEVNILDSIPDVTKYKSFTERYFTKRYVLDVGGVKNNDIMIMFHSNRVALLCLAPSHFVFKKDDKYKINYLIGKIDRLSNCVKGKSKKGGQILLPKSVICKVEYSDDLSFDVPCCMKGTLIEVNEELVKFPQILREQPDSDGYIAVILSSIANSEATKTDLLTHEEYIEIIKNRLVDDE